MTTRVAIGCFVSNKKSRGDSSENYGSPMAYYTPTTLSAQGKCSGPVAVLSTTLPTKTAAKSARPTSGGRQRSMINALSHIIYSLHPLISPSLPPSPSLPGVFEMTLDLFPALDVAPFTLRGARSSRGDVPFAFNDVVFGYQVPG